MPAVALTLNHSQRCTSRDCCRYQIHRQIMQCLRRASRPFMRVLQGKRHDESESDDEWTDEEEDSAPLDNVDPFVFFADSLHSVQSQMPARFQVCVPAHTGC